MSIAIKDIADIINISVSDPANSGYDVFVGLEHYDIGEPVITRFGSTKMLTTACKLFAKGDILLARRNVYLRRAGVVNFDGLTSGDSIVIRVKKDITIDGVDANSIALLLPFILNTNKFWDFANTNSDGTMSKRLSPQTLLSYEFELPTTEEQKPLVEKLWAAYKLKNAKMKLIESIDEMVKSQFIEMFGSIDDNKHLYPIKSLKDICDCYAGATPSTSNPGFWEGGSIPWMSSGEVNKIRVSSTDAHITELGYRSSSTKMVPPNSVVIALAGQGKTRGTVAVNEIELCTNQSLCAIVPSSAIHFEYLFHNLRGRYLELRGMAGDVNGRGGLNLKIVNSIRIILPPMEDQMRFVEFAQQADKSKFDGFKSQFIEMFGAEDILHARWPLFRMDEVFSISSSRRILKSEWKDQGTIPFIRVRDMVQLANKEPLTNEFFVSEDFYNSRPEEEKVKPGDIIVSATSTVGKTYIIKPGERFYFKDADVLLFRKVKEINEVFFTYGLSMPTLWNQIKSGLGGTTVAHFLISNACKLMQPLPPLELQEQFCVILEQADKSKSINFS